MFEFGPEDESLPDIKPAKEHIPNWYKNIKPYNYKNVEFSENNFLKTNVKACVPFLDSLVSGYMITLSCDIHFEPNEDGTHTVRWGRAEPAPLALRDLSLNPMPLYKGFSGVHYIWTVPYAFKLPKGYSAIITHPFNRLDLPFISLTGIVDAPKVLQKGNFPFFIREDFSGIIEAGTPILQIIPFKNEEWKSIKNDNLFSEGVKLENQSKRHFFGFYKNNFWQKKKYE